MSQKAPSYMFGWLKNTLLYQYHLYQKNVLGDVLLSILHHLFLSGKASSGKVACRVKTNTTWTTKNRTSSHYFNTEFKISILHGHKRQMKYLGLGRYNLHIQLDLFFNGLSSTLKVRKSFSESQCKYSRIRNDKPVLYFTFLNLYVRK